MKVFFCMCLQQLSHMKSVIKIIIATLESKKGKASRYKHKRRCNLKQLNITYKRVRM